MFMEKNIIDFENWIKDENINSVNGYLIYKMQPYTFGDLYRKYKNMYNKTINDI